MAEEAVIEEEQVIEPEIEEELDEEVVDAVADSPIEDSEEEGDEVLEISLGDESLTSNEEEEEDKSAPAWVKDLRKSHKEIQREKRELQRRLEAIEAEKQAAPVQTTQIDKKPTLEDFEYDTEKYDEALGQWYKQERKREETQAQQQAEFQRQQKEYQAQLENYAKAKQELKLKDYDDAEAVAIDAFDPIQQEVVVKYAKNPALAVYAIGKNPQRAKELSAIKDPVKFAIAINDLENKLKVNKRKAKLSPEGKVVASGKKSGVDSTLERLEREAEQTNDRTKVAAYKRQLRAKKQS